MELILPDYDPKKYPVIWVKTPELMEKMFEHIFPGEAKPIHPARHYWEERKEDSALYFLNGSWRTSFWSILSKQTNIYQLYDAEELLAIQSVNKEAFLHLI